MIGVFVVALCCGVALADVACSDLDATLRCSACGHFVDGLYAATTRDVFRAKTSVRKVYRDRLVAIYRAHAPDKIEGVDGLLAKAKGKEHALYDRVCAKYGVDPEPPHDGESSDEKRRLVLAAIQSTVDAVGSQQWAESDDNGRKTFVDFNKAMSGGSITGSISMGPEVSAKLTACYASWAEAHEGTLVARLVAVKRAYDSKLHKSFCDNIGACGTTDPDDFFEL